MSRPTARISTLLLLAFLLPCSGQRKATAPTPKANKKATATVQTESAEHKFYSKKHEEAEKLYHDLVAQQRALLDEAKQMRHDYDTCAFCANSTSAPDAIAQQQKLLEKVKSRLNEATKLPID